MDSKMTFALSIVALVVGVGLFLWAIIALNTPVSDIGMLSTSVVFVLFGAFGLWLARTQKAQGN